MVLLQVCSYFAGIGRNREKNLELRRFYTGRTTSYTTRTTSYMGLVRQIRKQIKNLETMPIKGRSAKKAYIRDFLHLRAHSGGEKHFLRFGLVAKLGDEVEKQKTRVLFWIFFFFGFYHDFSLSHLFYLL